MIDKLILIAKENNTPLIDGPECPKCGCTVYYVKDGKRNVCLYCARNKAKAAVEWLGEVDHLGEKVFTGRRCSKCKGHSRLFEPAYGAKAGTCRDCAVAKEAERQNSLPLKLLSSKANNQLWAFLVHSIEQAKTLQVAPRNMAEFYLVKNLVIQCRALNLVEEQNASPQRWEVCHKFPASGAGTYRGRAEVANLFIGRAEVNRETGATVPAEFDESMIVRIGEEDYLGKVSRINDLVRERLGMPSADRAKAVDYGKRVKGAVREITELHYGKGQIPSLNHVYADVMRKWLRVQKQLNRRVANYLAMNLQSNIKSHGFDLFQLDTFEGANARLLAVKLTIEQFFDAGDNCRKTPLSEALALWALDTLNKPKAAIVGFTHELLDNPLVWGTRADVDGRQWLCAWRHNGLEDARLTAEADLIRDELGLMGPLDDAQRYTELTAKLEALEQSRGEVVADSSMTRWELLYIKEEERRELARIEAEEAARAAEVAEAERKAEEARAAAQAARERAQRKEREAIEAKAKRMLETYPAEVERLYQEAAEILPHMMFFEYQREDDFFNERKQEGLAELNKQKDACFDYLVRVGDCKEMRGLAAIGSSLESRLNQFRGEGLRALVGAVLKSPF